MFVIKLRNLCGLPNDKISVIINVLFLINASFLSYVLLLDLLIIVKQNLRNNNVGNTLTIK